MLVSVSLGQLWGAHMVALFQTMQVHSAISWGGGRRRRLVSGLPRAFGRQSRPKDPQNYPSMHRHVFPNSNKPVDALRVSISVLFSLAPNVSCTDLYRDSPYGAFSAACRQWPNMPRIWLQSGHDLKPNFEASGPPRRTLKIQETTQ